MARLRINKRTIDSLKPTPSERRGGIGSALGPFAVGYVSDVSSSLLVAMSVPVIGIPVASVMARRTGKFVRAKTPAPGTVSG